MRTPVGIHKTQKKDVKLVCPPKNARTYMGLFMLRIKQMGYLNFSSVCNNSFQCFVCFFFFNYKFLSQPFSCRDVVGPPVIITYYIVWIGAKWFTACVYVLLLLRCVGPFHIGLCGTVALYSIHMYRTWCILYGAFIYSGQLKRRHVPSYSLDLEHVLI